MRRLSAFSRLRVTYSAARLGCLCLATISATFAQAQNISINDQQLRTLDRFVRKNHEAGVRFAKLCRFADVALGEMPSPVVDVDTAMRLIGDPIKTQTIAAMKDMEKIQALGFAYKLTDNEEYFRKQREYILAWVNTNVPASDPVNGNNYEGFLMGYDLTRSKFDSAERRQIDAWVRNFASRQVASRNDSIPDNRQSLRIKTVGLVGFLLKDKSLKDWAIAAFKKQIYWNIHPDGATYDFNERDAVYYHLVDLKPLLTFARVAKLNGVHLYNYTSERGTNIDMAIDFLMPFVRGDKIHHEFQYSSVDFDKARARNEEPDFERGHLFDPKDALPCLELAAYFLPSMDKWLPRLSDIDGVLKYPDFDSVWILALRASLTDPLTNGSTTTPAP